MVSVRLTISKDDPCLFITAVANNRLPVFRADAIKTITCGAIDEARTSCGFLLFAYVIMPDHIHVLTDSPRKPSAVLQFIKGIVSRLVLGYLKEMKYDASLSKLAHDDWKRNHRYSLWQHFDRQRINLHAEGQLYPSKSRASGVGGTSGGLSLVQRSLLEQMRA